jgi:hypothetical protein
VEILGAKMNAVGLGKFVGWICVVVLLVTAGSVLAVAAIEEGPSEDRWSSRAIEDLVTSQPTVEKADCRSMTPGRSVQRFSCEVKTVGHSGRLIVRVGQDGVVRSVGHGVPAIAVLVE